MTEDESNGWDAVAAELIDFRSDIGLATVRRWAASLPEMGSVVDIGAGSGVPLSAALIEDKFAVYAIDASQTLVAAFRRRFPNVATACERAECSRFFGRTFDGAMAIGLMFLLPADSQRELIHRVAGALKPRGRFLFSAPQQACTWNDAMTGRPSKSLGATEYAKIIASAGMRFLGSSVDEGENYYYYAQKRGE